MLISHKTRRGFTLIEMLVVLSVLGILVSLAGHHHTRVLKKSQDAALMLELTTLRTAVHQFALDNNGRFPEALAELKSEYLKNLPTNWRGSNESGLYSYNALSGEIELYNAAGSALAENVDAGGKNYANY